MIFSHVNLKLFADGVTLYNGLPKVNSLYGLSWADHCKLIKVITVNAVNFLYHTLWVLLHADTKAVAYECVIKPLMEYGC